MSISMILCWEWIDTALYKTLAIMNNIPGDLYGTIEMSRALAAIISLLVMAAESYLMMTGKRGMDAMKLLRIAIISIAITQSPILANGIRSIFLGSGDGTGGVEYAFRQTLLEQEQQIAQLQNEIALKRSTMLVEIDNKRVEIEKAKYTGIFGNNWIGEGVGATIGFAKNEVNELLSGTVGQMVHWQSASFGTAFKRIVNWIAETIFQVVYYGLLVGQRVFLGILTIFLPFALALSLAPMYKNAWSQWLSKYLSICLWSIVLYISMRYINTLIITCLESDLISINATINNAAKDGVPWANVSAIWNDVWNNFGSALNIVVAYLIGTYVIRQVPEVCSWLIPGGVGSHWGHTVGGVTQAMAMYAGAKVYQGAKTGVGALSGSMGQSNTSGPAASSITSVNTGIGGDQSSGFGNRSAELQSNEPPQQISTSNDHHNS